MTPPTNETSTTMFLEKALLKSQRARWRRFLSTLILLMVGTSFGVGLVMLAFATARAETVWYLATLYVCVFATGFTFFVFRGLVNEQKNSRRILAEILEKSAEARIITGPDGETRYTNVRFAQLVHGMGDPSLKTFALLFEDSLRAEKTLEDLRLRASPAGTASVEMHGRLNGKPVWFQVTCQFIVDRPGHIHWRIDDITARHKMEAAIREEREKLIDFTDNAPVGFFSVDEQGRFLFANDTLSRLLGMDIKTLRTMTLHQFLADPPAQGRPYDVFVNGDNHQHGEVTMKGAGGRLFKAAVTHSISATQDGKILTRSVVYDLTAEQRMQQALKESQDRFERLFEEAPVGICLIGASRRISDTNTAFISMLGLPRSDVEGKPLSTFIAPEDHDKIDDWLKRFYTGDRAYSFIETRLRGAHETVTQLYARKFRGGDSLVLHFIDLTEQKNLEQQFTQSQKMQAVGQLAGGIAHDFNNLLTAMIGFCDLLLLRHKPGDPSFADIMQIKQNANRAANLVRQLLAFSRQQTLQPRVLDVTDVLTELTHLLRRLIGANIDLTISHGTDLGLIKADQGQMEQVLINLVVNARDAMPKGGKLEIHTTNVSNRMARRINGDDLLPPGDWVSLTVKDTGGGIPPEVLPRIFEPFFSTKEVGAGTGLGLSTVHGIVHQTGGYIAVESVSGQGTSFTLYLPRHKATEASADGAAIEDKSSPADLTGSARILLVEDEDAVRTFSARALSNKGYEVADSASGLTALHMIEQGQFEPDLLITDVMMPEMDGPTLARAVKERRPSVKIIFISGYAEDKFKEHLGADVYFLPKPFSLKQLATKVKEVLE